MDRSRYRIIEKNEDIWRIFCGIVIYVGLLCILPWGNFGLWNMLDYASLKSEEVREHAREVKVQWSTEMQVVDSSGKEVMPIAIFHGILIDLSVPFFVNLFCSL